MKVILLGPPGAGKGTQAARIAASLGVNHVSSGDLFRAIRQQDSELGRLVRSYYDKGELVPDDVTIKMIMDWINAPGNSKGFVLDGFPRTIGQAQALDEAMNDKGGIDRVLYIKVSQEELIRRLGGRLICRNCGATYNLNTSPPKQEGRCDRCGGELYQRDDDKPEAVRRRIEVYAKETEPLVGYYRSRSNLREIDGEGSIEEVGRALVAAAK
ncbi:MAG: adenylate kinase [Chloroflexi bacterium]|nr:adenylate kinase [Chloroflexota bacterium]